MVPAMSEEAVRERFNEFIDQIAMVHEQGSSVSLEWARIAWEFALETDPEYRLDCMEDFYALCNEEGFDSCPRPTVILSYADTYQKWTRTTGKAGRRQFAAPSAISFSVLRELRNLPERFDLVEKDPTMTLDDAKSYLRKVTRDDPRDLHEIKAQIQADRRRQRRSKKPERDFDETIDAVLRRFNVVLNEWLELLDQSVQKDEEVIDMRTFKQVLLNAESIIDDLRQLEPTHTAV